MTVANRVRCVALLVITALGVPARAEAQTPRDGTLLLTVVDSTGGVLPGAIVTMTGQDTATRARKIDATKTTENGLATIGGLVIGRYTVQAEFRGFTTGVLKDLQIRAGENKHKIVLPLKTLDTSVTVTQDPREAATDRAGLFGTALTREQIGALSEDPDEMRRQLLELMGPDAVIRVDSFEGGQLPPKGQIRAIRMARDQFAAENHYAGGHFIEIITQPGSGPIRGGVNVNYTSSALESRNPFAPTKGPSASNNGGVSFSGTLIENKIGFSISMNGSTSYSTPLLRVALPGGTRTETLSLRQPNGSVYGYGSFDYAMTKNQTLRGWFSVNRFTSKNMGVGAYDLPERGFWTEDRYWNLNLQHSGPLGRRAYMYNRLTLGKTDWDYHSHVEAPTIRVLDAFTSGGAQRTGGRRSWNVSAGSDLDYIRGIHSWRAGVSLEGLIYRSDEALDYLGTYTFSSLADYEAGRPRSYTRRVGDPLVAYNNVYAGIYVQDDIRLSKTLTLSPGVRYEAQTHLSDFNNVAPRFGLTWSPFTSGKTSIRASAGIFYDWISTSTYEQTLRVDGFRQQELNVLDPDYPDPGLGGTTPPINRYLYSDDVRMLRTMRLSLGVQQTVTTRLRVGATYTDSRGLNVARGRNLNAPVAGVRPDPAFANVIAVTSDAENRSRSLGVNFSLSLAAPSPSLNQAFFNWRRGAISGNYNLAKSENNSDGTFTVPASNDLATEWGPSSGDVRHRVSLSMSSQAIKNFSASFGVSASTAGPYTIRTGVDDNGDLIFNDRPAGVGRNSARAAGRWEISGSFSYSVGFGRRRLTLPPGVSVTSMGGVATVSTTAAQQAPRYRIGFSARVSNLTNRHNLTGFSGVMTSPFFGKPQSASGVRKMNLSMNLGF